MQAGDGIGPRESAMGQNSAHQWLNGFRPNPTRENNGLQPQAFVLKSSPNGMVKIDLKLDLAQFSGTERLIDLKLVDEWRDLDHLFRKPAEVVPMHVEVSTVNLK